MNISSSLPRLEIVEARPIEDTVPMIPCAFCDQTEWNNGTSIGMHFATFPCVLQVEGRTIQVHFAELITAISSGMLFCERNIRQSFDSSINHKFKSEGKRIQHILNKFLESTIKRKISPYKKEALRSAFFSKSDDEIFQLYRGKDAVTVFRRIYDLDEVSNSVSSKSSSSSSSLGDSPLTFTPAVTSFDVLSPSSSTSFHVSSEEAPRKKRKHIEPDPIPTFGSLSPLPEESSSSSLSSLDNFSSMTLTSPISYGIMRTSTGEALQVSIGTQSGSIDIQDLLSRISSNALLEALRRRLP